MKTNSKNGGFISLIILIIVVLVILSYLGFDIKKIIYSPIVVQIFTLVWDLIVFTLKLFVTLIRESWGTIIQIPQFLTKFIQSLKQGN